MNNELAKKLKDAGFPIHGYVEAGDYDYCWTCGNKQGDCIPTLSELIEACGEKLWSLTRHGKIWQTNWRDGLGGEAAGETPEEAVANLWLALHTT